MAIDYSGVTEIPGNQVTREALSMMCTRYAHAATMAHGLDVLEVACGAGQGLGWLATTARRVIGADYTGGLLQQARQHYGTRVPLVQSDAHWLPFRDHTFDLVILYEAIYYLSNPTRFLAECRRVLRNPGSILVCSANREWSDFNPSPFSQRYFSARELRGMLSDQGFAVDLFGAFPVERRSIRDRLVSLLKRTAVALHLIPKTMKGKTWLKRIFLGQLTLMPPEVTAAMASSTTLMPVPTDGPTDCYKVIYAVGRVGVGGDPPSGRRV